MDSRAHDAQQVEKQFKLRKKKYEINLKRYTVQSQSIDDTHIKQQRHRKRRHKETKDNVDFIWRHGVSDINVETIHGAFFNKATQALKTHFFARYQRLANNTNQPNARRTQIILIINGLRRRVSLDGFP